MASPLLINPINKWKSYLLILYSRNSSCNRVQEKCCISVKSHYHIYLHSDCRRCRLKCQILLSQKYEILRTIKFSSMSFKNYTCTIAIRLSISKRRATERIKSLCSAVWAHTLRIVVTGGLGWKKIYILTYGDFALQRKWKYPDYNFEKLYGRSIPSDFWSEKICQKFQSFIWVKNENVAMKKS